MLFQNFNKYEFEVTVRSTSQFINKMASIMALIPPNPLINILHMEFIQISQSLIKLDANNNNIYHITIEDKDL